MPNGLLIITLSLMGGGGGGALSTNEKNIYEKLTRQRFMSICKVQLGKPIFF